MGWQPGLGDGKGASPDRDPGCPARRLCVTRGWPGSRGDGLQEAPAPSGRLALAADEVSGPGRRCPGATDNELIGLVQAWAAIESWACGAKLGVIAELIRRENAPRMAAITGTCPMSGHPRCAMSLPSRWPARSSRRRRPRGWRGSSRPGCQASGPCSEEAR